MKKLTPLFFWSILIIITFASCKASKKATTDVVKVDAVGEMISILADRSFHPSWFKAKAKLQSKMNGKGLSFSSTIISKNEELLWLNGKVFGIEGARFLLTPDSIFAINRLQKEYLAENKSWVAEEFQLPATLSKAIDLKYVQDIFIGNPILDLIPYTEITPKESDILLTGEEDGYSIELMVNSSTMHTKYFNVTDGESLLSVKYDDYRMVDEKHSIAHRRDVSISRPNEGDILLSIFYDNISINEEQKIKFNIPGHYSKM